MNEEPNKIEKFLVTFSMLLYSSVVSSICVILLMIFKGDGYFPKLYTFINIAIVVGIGIYVFEKAKIRRETIGAAGFLGIAIFPLLWSLIPIKVPSDYVGLRLTEEDGYILDDSYCQKDCAFKIQMIKKGYYVERNFYSWKWAKVLGRFPADNKCCYPDYKYSSKYLFGIFLLLELTFEYIPIILLLTILSTLLNYYRNKDSSLFYTDFINPDKYNHKLVVTTGIVFIIILFVYNGSYMNLY